MAKKITRKTKASPNKGPDAVLGSAMVPPSVIAVATSSFDSFLSDLALIRQNAADKADRIESRDAALARWHSKDIATMVRVEGVVPGWGITTI